MLYLYDAIYEWLSTASPDTLWMLGDQVSSPPRPQDAGSFGYYIVTEAKNLSMGNQRRTYNEATDKIDIDLINSEVVTVAIDIYSQNEVEDGKDAETIARRVIAYAQSTRIDEYFYSNDIGFLKFTKRNNMSEIESGQVRKRFRIECEFFIHTEVATEVDRIVEAPFTLAVTS